MEVKIFIELIENKKENIRIFGDKFVGNNKNLDICINGKNVNLTSYYNLENDEVII